MTGMAHATGLVASVRLASGAGSRLLAGSLQHSMGQMRRDGTPSQESFATLRRRARRVVVTIATAAFAVGYVGGMRADLVAVPDMLGLRHRRVAQPRPASNSEPSAAPQPCSSGAHAFDAFPKSES
jgi:hypothetical protein